MSKTFSSTFYLALSEKKSGRFSSANDLTARLSSKPPALARGEIAMRLHAEVPMALFSTPTLNAKVFVPEGVATPAHIDATVIDNVQEVLRQQTGFDVRVEAIES